jgi:hypothetical protein
MNSLYRYFKLLFSDDAQLISLWNQLSSEKVPERSKQAIAKELQKREYRYDGDHWIKSQKSNAG